MTSCSFCKKAFPSSNVEHWSSSEKSAWIEQPAIPMACIDSTGGELWICETCYAANRFVMLTSDEKSEIHYQMGLEYQSRSDYVKSIKSFNQVPRNRRDADLIASLALSYEGISNVKIAEELYEEALSLDPEHVMSRENLVKLRQTNRGREGK